MSLLHLGKLQLILIAIGLGLIAACAQPSAGPAAKPAAAPKAATQPTTAEPKEGSPKAAEKAAGNALAGQTIKLGVEGPFSGGQGVTYGVEMKQATELAVDEVNASGGILGAKVAIELGDDEGQPKKGEVVAQKLCDDNAVLAVAGPVNSAVTIPSTVVYEKCGLVSMTAIATNPQITERGLKYNFRLNSRDDLQGPAVAYWMIKEMGKKNVYIVDDGVTYGKGIADEFAKQFEKMGGKVAGRAAVRVGDKDFRAVIGQMPKDIDSVFFGGVDEGTLYVKQMRELGWNQLMAGGDGLWNVEGYIDAAEGAAEKGEGSLVATTAPAIGTVPGSEEFKKKYEAKYGRVVAYATTAYDAARLLMQAIKDAAQAKQGMPTRDEVRDALRKLQNWPGIAYANPVVFDEKGDNINSSIFVNLVEKGKFKEVGEVKKKQLQ